MPNSQITGANGGIVLTSATYGNPVTVDSGAVYSYALRTRKSAGSMMRKLSVTVSQ